MQLRAPLLLLSMLGAAAAATTDGPKGRNTWSKNVCEVATKTYPALGLANRNGPTNCNGYNANPTLIPDFGMYFGIGRGKLTQGYPALKVFADSFDGTNINYAYSDTFSGTSINFIEARNFIHALIGRYIKFYIYVQCRCTENMTPAMTNLQKCFLFNECNTGNTIGTGLIKAFQDFYLDSNNETAIKAVAAHLKILFTQEAFDNLRCDRTSNLGSPLTQVTATGTDVCSIRITKRGTGAKVSLGIAVACPKGKCPKVGNPF